MLALIYSQHSGVFSFFKQSEMEVKKFMLSQKPIYFVNIKIQGSKRSVQKFYTNMLKNLHALKITHFFEYPSALLTDMLLKDGFLQISSNQFFRDHALEIALKDRFLSVLDTDLVLMRPNLDDIIDKPAEKIILKNSNCIVLHNSQYMLENIAQYMLDTWGAVVSTKNDFGQLDSCQGCISFDKTDVLLHQSRLRSCKWLIALDGYQQVNKTPFKIYSQLEFTFNDVYKQILDYISEPYKFIEGLNFLGYDINELIADVKF